MRSGAKTLGNANYRQLDGLNLSKTPSFLKRMEQIAAIEIGLFDRP